MKKLTKLLLGVFIGATMTVGVSGCGLVTGMALGAVAKTKYDAMQEEGKNKNSSSVEESSSMENSSVGKNEETHTHVWIQDEIVAPVTCTTNGITTYFCECGESKFEKILAQGHVYQLETSIPLTCTTDGVYSYLCKCGESKIQVLNAVGHVYQGDDCVKCDFSKITEAADGMLYRLNDDEKSYSVYSIGNCTEQEIIIPERYNDLPVTGILGEAFYGCTSLTKVVIPATVTTIGDSAFSYCANLTSLTIPNSVTKIGRCAFLNCESLASFTFSSSVATIGREAFSNCYALENVYYTGDIADWCNITFDHYTASPSNTLNNNNAKLYIKGELLTELVIPQTIDKIKSYAFDGCISLRKVIIPDHVTEIANSAFFGCSNLEEVIIGDGVTQIGAYAFETCTNLKSVVIGRGVTRINRAAFSLCTNLTHIYFKGTSAEWATININLDFDLSYGDNNGRLTLGNILYYYSEQCPTSSWGNWWYYDENGLPAVWTVA